MDKMEDKQKIYETTEDVRESVIGHKSIKLQHGLVQPLTDSEYQRLDWKEPFGYDGMVRIRTATDGSCFFHALAKSYCLPYIRGKLDDNTPINRRNFIRAMRRDLAKQLGTRVDPENPLSPTYYDTLSRGKLKEFSASVPQYTLEKMQKELDSDHSVDNVYNEFISNELDKDIYILDLVKRDVYITGDDDEILYKGRQSIVLLYLPGHYELIGIKTGDCTQTIFHPDHDFIQSIRQRMAQIRRF
jgi:hypothetical protein